VPSGEFAVSSDVETPEPTAQSGAEDDTGSTGLSTGISWIPIVSAIAALPIAGLFAGGVLTRWVKKREKPVEIAREESSPYITEFDDAEEIKCDSPSVSFSGEDGGEETSDRSFELIPDETQGVL
jgi:hypothetical protein